MSGYERLTIFEYLAERKGIKTEKKEDVQPSLNEKILTASLEAGSIPKKERQEKTLVK